MTSRHQSPSRVGRAPRTRREAFGDDGRLTPAPLSKGAATVAYVLSIVVAVGLAAMIFFDGR